MKITRIMLLLTTMFMLSGCALTKVVTVPMRVGGAVISIVPVAGTTMHDAIDQSANVIDEMPF